MPSAENERGTKTSETSETENLQVHVDAAEQHLDTVDEASHVSGDIAASEFCDAVVGEEWSEEPDESSLGSFPAEEPTTWPDEDRSELIQQTARELVVAKVQPEVLHVRGTVEHQFWPLLHETKNALEHSRGDLRRVEVELERLRDLGVDLNIDLEKIADRCLESERRSVAAATAIGAIEERLKQAIQAHDVAAQVEKSAHERAHEQAGALEIDLARLREISTQLSSDYERLAETSREGERRNAVATVAISAIDERLTKSTQAHELATQINRDTLERTRDSLRAIEVELARLRELGGQLTTDYEKIGESCRENERRNLAASTSITTIEERLARAAQAHQLASQIDTRVDAMRALADEVDRTFCAFAAHKERIAEDVAEARRLADFAWGVDERMVKLEQHDRKLSDAEQVVGRLTSRANDAIAQFDQRLAAVEGGQKQVEDAAAAIARLNELVSSLEARAAAMAGVGLPRTLPSDVPEARDKTVARRIRGAIVDALQWVRRIRAQHKSLSMGREVALGLAGVAAITLFVLYQHGSWSPAMAIQSEAGIVPRVLDSRSLSPVRFAIPRLASADLSESGAVEMLGTSAYAQVSGQEQDSGRSPSARKGRTTVVRATPAMSAPQAASASADQANETFVGDLAVQSEPSGAVVFVNGRRVGETPLEITRLRAGSHLLRMERQGYGPWTASVLVTANRRTPISARLQPDSGR